jgi:hypothetical protein
MGRTACTEPQCLYKGDLYLFNLFKEEDWQKYCAAGYMFGLKTRVYALSNKIRVSELSQTAIGQHIV